MNHFDQTTRVLTRRARIHFTHSHDNVSKLHLVTMSGTMDLDAAKAMLRLLRRDSAYQQSAAVIYDIGEGGLDALPDANDMLVLSRYVATNKCRRGPVIIAFVAPGFASAGMKRVFAGFAKVVGLSLNFRSSEYHARALIAAATEKQ